MRGRAADRAYRSRRAQILERFLVKVNGDILTQTELEEKQTAALAPASVAGPEA